MTFLLYTSSPFLQLFRHLRDPWCDLLEQKFHKEIRLLTEELFEAVSDTCLRLVTLDADREDVILDLWHGCLTHYVFVVGTEHLLALLLKLWVLL